MKKSLIILLMLSIPFIAFGQGKPTLPEIQKVLKYYYDGQGQPVVLVDKKLCEGTFKEGDEKYNCMNEYVDNTLSKDEKAIIWMNFFGPEAEKYSILVQFDRNGITRHSTALSITGSIRYRANANIVTSTAGKWKINIYMDGEEKTELLGSVEYKVNK